MRYSQFFGRTKLESPHDTDSINARLLTQAGFIDKVAAGIYNLLPLGARVLAKVRQIIREEMNAIDGQEILMPTLHPIEIWQQTGRDKTMDGILYRTKGSGDKDFVLGPSHEETVTPLAVKQINSYKDLPMAVYQIQTKFRDEPRAKSGLLRGREFGMKDMYSFHTDEKDLDKYYERAKEAYFNVYKRCGLEAYIVEASGGAFTDQISHEFSILTPAGEDTILLCKKCGVAQNLEIAEGNALPPNEDDIKEEKMKKVPANREPSIEAGTKLHKCEPWQILKTVVYSVEDTGLVGICIRGDLNVNEHKLERYFKKLLKPGTNEELKKAKLYAGFISPIGNDRIPFFADHSVRHVKNWITGANKNKVDLVNANLGRDFRIKEFADFVEVKGGFKCPKCESQLEEKKAIEAGNIFKLGTKYSDAFNLQFTDKDGKKKKVIMGCYGIGSTRLIGTIVEAKHDDKGMIWPKSVAPYLVHLVALGNDEKVAKKADELYEKMKSKGIEVLYDDRDESPGKKFNDADLIGLPVRMVVSNRTLEKDGVEWKLRVEEGAKDVKFDKVIDEILKYRDA
ncbi:MAG: proline--tRNA ligase [Patescibacteria group bacterium]|nr:proline--tRNA ligase [Patescibacteria group bacterium]